MERLNGAAVLILAWLLYSVSRIYYQTVIACFFAPFLGRYSRSDICSLLVKPCTRCHFISFYAISSRIIHRSWFTFAFHTIRFPHPFKLHVQKGRELGNKKPLVGYVVVFRRKGESFHSCNVGYRGTMVYKRNHSRLFYAVYKLLAKRERELFHKRRCERKRETLHN